MKADLGDGADPRGSVKPVLRERLAPDGVRLLRLSVGLAARRSAVQAATDAQRQLHALVVAAPDPLRGQLRGLTTPRLVSTCGRLRQQAVWDTETCAPRPACAPWPTASNS
jgi:hypothetical protein